MSNIIDLKKEKEEDDIKLHKEHKSEERSSRSPHEISWSGPMSSHEPDPVFGLWVGSVLWAGAVLAYLFSAGIITAIFLALLGGMVVLQTRQKREFGSFKISPAGVSVNDKKYKIDEIKTFWVEYEPDEKIKELSLHIDRWYMPFLRIPLGDQNPLQIRNLLLPFIPEERHEDTLVEIIGRKLGL